MNNQENQPGSTTPGNDTRNQNAGTTTGSAAGARKGSTTTSQARGASSQGATASTDQNATTSASSQAESTDQQGNQLLNTALESSKKWIEDSGVLNSVNDLPQTVKDWSSRAANRVGGLTTTQKIVGGALLAAGIGYLATRKSAGKDDKPKSRYGRQSGSNYGRSSGYQAPDASNSRRTSVGSGRTDSGSAYGNSSTASYGASTGSGFGASPSGSDASARTSESSYRSKNDDFRSVE